MTDEHVPVSKTKLRSGRVKVVGYVLMVVITLGVFELSAYLYLRIFAGYDGQHLMSYQFDDYKNIQLTPGYRNTHGVFHNPQGFRRSTDTARAKPAGVYRIFVMGGSTAYGLQSMSRYGQEKYGIIRNDETIDYYLERYLGEQVGREHVEVINAAITSHYSHHHLIYLNQTILKYSPDMVVFVDGFNDYYAYQRGFDQFLDYAYQERTHQMLNEPSVSAWLEYTGWWLFRKSHMVYLAGKTLLPFWQRVHKIGKARAHIDVDTALADLRVNARRNFVKMIERSALILRHEGVVPVFTLQPELVFKQQKVLSPLEQKIYHELDSEWQENFVEYKNRARPIVIEYASTAAERFGALFFDLTDIYGGVTGDVYTDYCHLTPLGNQRLAESLGEKLLPIVRKHFLARRAAPAGVAVGDRRGVVPARSDIGS
jgi:lysophospholipase L1-like esterase